MSGLFDDPPAATRQAPPPRPQRSRALLYTAIALVVLFFLLSAFTGVWTDRLWFQSVGFSTVFTTVISTRVLLFLGFGAFLGVVMAVNVWLAYRFRPLFRAPSLEQAGLDRYREAVDPVGKWLVIGIGLVFGLFAGGSASGQWRTYLLWRNGEDFGQDDPYFNRDIGFFVFDLPWLHYLVNFAMTTIVLALIAAAVVHYLYGGIRLQARRDRLSGAAQVHLSVLLGLFVLFKAADYWLDRFDLSTETGRKFTGVNYTAFNAVLPSKNILMFIALLCAVLFFANVVRRTWLLPTLGLGLLVVSAILLGAVWPGIVYQFQVRPNEPDREEPFIEANIAATRQAYQVDDSEVTSYNANVSVTNEQLREDAASIPGVRLIDPALTNQTFEQLQQVRGFYSVPDVLDVDRYEINGRTRDIVIAVRELDQSGLRSEQQNWANLHTVYTHGYGVVAAYGNQRDADNQPLADNNDGEPVFAERDLPPNGELSDLFGEDGYEPRIYFGEQSPTYSIVGKVGDSRDVELNIPDANTDEANTTYDGADGVSVGGLFNQVLYALRFGEPNILLSGRVNENSKILYERNPRDRVEKVAPWLTVDGDPYPAVVDGRVLWILDGYTLTNRFPNSELRSFEDMTSDSLTPQPAFGTLPTDEINYIRNSVKAVVDAYDGTVTLYAWDEDPILEAWMKAFPGTVEPRSSISDELMNHLRYPEDMFKVQRNILGEYHVTAPQTFYQGTDRWTVPVDPSNRQGTTAQPPYRLSVTMPTEDGTSTSEAFSLTSVYVPANRSNLASFIAVNSEASSEDYGKISILRLPDTTQVQGPNQIANTFSADEDIQAAILPFTQSGAQVTYGNLLTLPVGGGLLYVQPVYTLRQVGEGTYPVLRYVLASFGDAAGFGQTLQEALDNVLGVGGGEPVEPEPTPEPEPEPGEPTPTPTPTPTPAPSGTVLELLEQADAKFAEAETALQQGDLAAYQQATEEAQALIEQAIAQAEEDSAG